jgi:hypothetical protein
MIKSGNSNVDNLLLLIRCVLRGEDYSCPDDIDFDSLLGIAKKQQIYNLILPLLKEKNLLSAAQVQTWKDCYFSEIRKTVLLNSEREIICAVLDEEGIDYMFTKGLVLREYYPQTLMRQMSDNDILYDASRRDDLLRIMYKHGYYLADGTGISDDFKKPFCTFEFHREIITNWDSDRRELDLWKRAEKKPGTSQWIINKEDNYLYTILHMYQHYRSSGCGVRFLCDVFVLKDKLDFDWDYINSELERFGLTDFHKTVTEVCDCVFGSGELGEEGVKLLGVMFEDTVYGRSVDIQTAVERAGGKSRYIFRRIFQDREIMFGTYKKLEKYPFLLPYYHIKRWFDRWRYNRDSVKKEYNKIRNNKK